jgi:hypothetical protein
VKVIVKTTKCKTEAELRAFGAMTTMRGMVVNEIESIKSDEAALLAQGMPPGTNINACYIFEEGRTPYGAASLFALVLGGLAMAAGGLVLIFKPAKA